MKTKVNAMSKKICSCGNKKSAGAFACNKCLPDIYAYLELLDLPADEYAKQIQEFREEGFGPVGKCAKCGRNYIHATDYLDPESPFISRICVRCMNEFMEYCSQKALKKLEQCTEDTRI